jgi:hypothetical protein
VNIFKTQQTAYSYMYSHWKQSSEYGDPAWEAKLC